MIVGSVNRFREIAIELPVYDSQGREEIIEAILDTGFTGSLTLPPALIGLLGLPWRSRTTAILATGAVEQLEMYTATILWDGAPRTIVVQAVNNDPLLGMRLLDGHDLSVRVRVGGLAEIERIP